MGKVRIELSLQSQLDLEGLGRPEIDDFRYFLRARILAAFLILFLTTFIDFCDFRVPFGAHLASKSHPGGGELAVRFRIRFWGLSRPHFELILDRFWEVF